MFHILKTFSKIETNAWVEYVKKYIPILHRHREVGGQGEHAHQNVNLGVLPPIHTSILNPLNN